MTLIFIILGLAFVNLITADGNSPTYLFELFLENKFNSFPAWIRSNKLDPSPANPSEFVLFTNLLGPRYTFKIKNEQITGYAKATNNVSLTVEVDLKRQFFYVTYSTKGSFKLQGLYFINGTNARPERPLDGEGTWTYNMNGTLSEDYTYRFKVKPDGYLEIFKDVQLYNALLNGDPKQKNLSFDGYLEETADLTKFDKERMRNKFQKAFDHQRIQAAYPDYPTAALGHQFLTEVFQNTTYAEIINDKTHPTLSSSTTEKSSSSKPTEKSSSSTPTDESLHGQSCNFKASFYMLIFSFILLIYFQ